MPKYFGISRDRFGERLEQKVAHEPGQLAHLSSSTASALTVFYPVSFRRWRRRKAGAGCRHVESKYMSFIRRASRCDESIVGLRLTNWSRYDHACFLGWLRGERGLRECP